MSLAKITLIGRLGQAPEPTKSGGGCKFSVASDQSYTAKDGSKVEHTEWTNVVCWGKLAELCLKFLEKGRQVFVEGDKRTDVYEKDGVKQYSVQCKAETVKFLGSKSDGGGKSESGASEPATGGSDAGDDDIPF